ncbi:MAG: phosphoglycerate dehydrogenase [Gammaproteobacteria bacterium]|nr:phosphoglycerate dehydrogenase [Gammaproteobacteria bacterium]
MYKILTLNEISMAGLKLLPSDRYEVAAGIPDPDAVLVRSASLHDMPITPSLKAVGRAGAGVNNIPVEKLSTLGIPVFNAPGANANAVKELVIAGMLLSCRHICQAWDFTRNLKGDDAEIEKQAETGKKRFAGFELPGRTLGVVGLGAVGREVANAAVSLGMKVIGCDPSLTVEGAWRLSSQVQRAGSIDELLPVVDFLSFHVPLVEGTYHLLNAQRLTRMKKRAIVLNFSRCGIVDDEAVVAALDAGRIHGYVCDFPTGLLKNHPRVITLPHLGASTAEAEENCAVMVVEQVRDYLENGNVRNSVNFPEVVLARSEGAHRLTVVNANVPNMLGQISSALAKAGLNIVDMLNKSRGELAYTLVDVDQPVPQPTIAEIGAIEGVLAVRLVE